MTEREKLQAEMVAALDAAAAAHDRADTEDSARALAVWCRAYDALDKYDRTHPPAPTP